MKKMSLKILNIKKKSVKFQIDIQKSFLKKI